MTLIGELALDKFCDDVETWVPFPLSSCSQLGAIMDAIGARSASASDCLAGDEELDTRAMCFARSWDSRRAAVEVSHIERYVADVEWMGHATLVGLTLRLMLSGIDSDRALRSVVLFATACSSMSR